MNELGFALLGYGFMGRAHSLALRALPALEEGPAAVPRLVSICGRDAPAVERARAQYGWAEAVSDWREQVADDRVAIFDNAAPNDLHEEPCLAAARAGKHVFCEKPLAASAVAALRLWLEAERAGVVHMCGFNLRFLPAVRLARELLEGGQLGAPTNLAPGASSGRPRAAGRWPTSARTSWISLAGSPARSRRSPRPHGPSFASATAPRWTWTMPSPR
jgi:predicted dehydrogenase